MLRDLEIDLGGIAHRLQGLRGRLGLTQQEVAGAIGVSYRTYQYWEGGAGKGVLTSRGNYERLADHFSTSLADPITANWILYGSLERPSLDLDESGDGLQEKLQALVELEVQKQLPALRAQLLSELETARTTPAAPSKPGSVPERRKAAETG